MFVAGLLVYFSILASISIYYAKRSQTLEDFVFARRAVSLVPLIFTTWVANFGGGALVGWTAGFYQYGLDWWWLPLAFLAALVVFNLLLVKKVRLLEQVTVPDLMGARYGNRSRIISTVLMILIGILTTGFQILAFAGLLTVLTGSSLRTGTIFAAIAFMLITAAGGLSGMVVTDTIQASITFVGLPLAALLVMMQVGGPAELWTRLPQTHTHLGALTRSGSAIGDAFGFFGAIATSQVLIQKVLAAKSTRIAQQAIWILVPIYALTYIILWLLGSSARVLLGPGLGAEAVMGQLIKSRLPAFLAVVLVATLLGKITTSANSVLLAVGSNIARDVYQPLIRLRGGADRSVLVIRSAIAGVSLAGMGLALWMADILRLMLVTFWIAGVAFLVPMYAGYMSKKGTSQAAEWSMIGGALGVLVSYALISPARLHPTVPGFLVSLIVYVGVSFYSRRRRPGPLN